MHRSSMMGVLLFVAVAAAAAPPYVTAETTTDRVAPSTAGSQAQVMAMQQVLKDKGFDPGPIDGIVGPRTTAALRDYQRAENSTLIDRKGPVAALLILHMLFGDRQFPP
jgi:peptidoglycan hydrolase-like protein with peptidoglycan-binding domain